MTIEMHLTSLNIETAQLAMDKGLKLFSVYTGKGNDFIHFKVREQCNKVNSVQMEYLLLRGLSEGHWVIGSLIMKLQNVLQNLGLTLI
jgi:hypothetical protein